MHMVGMDLVGPLKETEDGYKYVLTLTDYFTKFVDLFPLKSKSAEEVCRAVQSFIYRWGPPEKILSDRGKEFVNKMNEALAHQYDIQRLVTSAYHPQCNGLDERTNQTLKNRLAKLVNEKQNDWNHYLEQVAYSIRTQRQASTKFSPFFLMFNRQPRLVSSTLPEKESEPQTQYPCEATEEDYETFVESMSQSTQQLHTQVLSNIEKAQRCQVEEFQKRVAKGKKVFALKPGDLVLRRCMKNIGRKGDQMAPKWLGPYKIVNISSHQRVELQSLGESQPLKEKVPYAQLKPYIQTPDAASSTKPSASCLSPDDIRPVSEMNTILPLFHLSPTLKVEHTKELQSSHPPAQHTTEDSCDPPIPEMENTTLPLFHLSPALKVEHAKELQSNHPPASGTQHTTEDSCDPPASATVDSKVSPCEDPCSSPPHRLARKRHAQNLTIEKIKAAKYRKPLKRPIKMASQLISREDKISSMCSVITSGSWLTDEEINNSQALLRQQFTRIDGFQDILVFEDNSCTLVGTPESPFVQILNVFSNHWVCLSNLRCSAGTVSIYDSIYRGKTSSKFIKQIGWLLHTKEKHMTLEWPDMQIQNDASDCGLFSIAVADALCRGVDPCICHWDQPAMRYHLAKCFRAGQMSSFPLTDSLLQQR